ncbi:MAG: hypothetical protein ETSY1_08095 [Candidatus Entotheonella factor]|uniref:Uncharacterized protein n=1 Tax=Entotheonella factor TaxID=1429438 RepID=W4LU40_ENTF1|nr:MAG: hypothetical protein ETSY1_08095 [Candidatus Entotheonella factor]
MTVNHDIRRSDTVVPLSDTERWELIRFIRSLRHPLAENG